MSTIVLRSVKGTPLTNTEVDANFSNLNTDKLQIGGTYSSGTASGVLFLNSSKVLTTGSALTFDGTNLGFGTTGQRITGDFSNGTVANRLAFQTSTANGATRLTVIPNGTGTITALNLHDAADPTNSSVAQINMVGGSTMQISSGRFGTGAYLPIAFLTDGSEQMRLTSTGLGIGTSSPSTYGGKLAVHSAPSTQATVFIQNPGQGSAHLGFAATGNNVKLYNCYNTGLLADGFGIDIGTTGNVGIGTSSPTTRLSVVSGTNAGISVNDGTVNTIIYNSTGGVSSLGTTTNHPIDFYTNNAAKMRLDTSGNLGLGVTPSAGDVYYRKIELGKVGCGLAVGTASLSSSELTYFTGNAVVTYTGANPFVYGNTGGAGVYAIEDGGHR